jgi:hypothetical protein
LINLVWEDWLAAIAPSLNVTASQAGIIMSFIFIFAFVLMIAMAAPTYADVGIPSTALIWALFFTYTAWLPVWTGTALSFILAIWVAISIKGGLS